jgi:8-oxo-dGTP diphosphatase
VTTSADVAAVVGAIRPGDPLERQHRDDTLAWLLSTDDVFYRTPPRTPPKHLAAYAAFQDEADGSILLVDHRRSGLWLPAGGHVEPGEDPADAAEREAAEELGADATFLDPSRAPVFLTATETVGPPERRHVDVSLWYLLRGSRQDLLTPDPVELAGFRWWTPQELVAADPGLFDPHLGRFLAKARHGNLRRELSELT